MITKAEKIAKILNDRKYKKLKIAKALAVLYVIDKKVIPWKKGYPPRPYVKVKREEVYKKLFQYCNLPYWAGTCKLAGEVLKEAGAKVVEKHGYWGIINIKPLIVEEENTVPPTDTVNNDTGDINGIL